MLDLGHEQPGQGSRAVALRRPSREAEESYLSVGELRGQYINYLTSKVDEIEEQKESRRYYHGAQWRAEDIRVLRARHQPVITYNRVARKINGIVGLTERMRQDPKAYPRTPQGEDGAEIATNVVRYVLEANDWKTREAECVRQCATEGIAGVEMRLVEGDHGDPDIELQEIFGEDFFYDPRSVRFDFSDARYQGLGKWLDLDAAIELFPDQEDLLRGLIETGSDLTTFSDREFRFINTTTKQVRLVEHWYKHRGKWCWAFYVGTNLLDEGLSPFFDERGKTIVRFFMFALAVDQDGDRYGFIRPLKGPQDEVNQRRSKALHISNSRRLILDKGAVDDVEVTRREWARPDGVVEKNPNLNITPDPTESDLAAQLQFLQEAKDEIEQFANVNPATLSSAVLQNLSGRAINLLQQPGLAEIGLFLLAYRGWKLRLYRAIFSTAQRYWTAERWVRVTDDEGVAKFIQLNGLDLDQHGQPAIVNHLGSLDVDVSLDEGPDISSMMNDSYDVLSRQPPGSVPLPMLIELMPIQGSVKKKLLQMMQQQPPPPPDLAVEQAKKLALEQAQASVRKTMADAADKEASAAGRRATALTDVARAAHLASEAHLNAAEVERMAQEAAMAPLPAASGGMPMPMLPAPPQMPPQQMPDSGLPSGGSYPPPF